MSRPSLEPANTQMRSMNSILLVSVAQPSAATGSQRTGRIASSALVPLEVRRGRPSELSAPTLDISVAGTAFRAGGISSGEPVRTSTPKSRLPLSFGVKYSGQDTTFTTEPGCHWDAGSQDWVQ